MIKTSYQTPELRNANDEVVQEGAFGKNTALANSTNDGWIDYVMNDLEALHDTIGDSAPTLDGNGHVVEPANLAIGDEDGVRLKTGYVKTSGGTVSGTLNVAQNLKMQDNQENVFGGMYVPASSATSQYLQLYGGETPSSNGGNLQLPSDGSWTLQAKNGTTAYDLAGNTDGTLKWRGNNVAVLASPAFTGTPTAPTQAITTANTRLATTEFVHNNLKTGLALGVNDLTLLNNENDLNNITTEGTYRWYNSSVPANGVAVGSAKMFVYHTATDTYTIQIILSAAGDWYKRHSSNNNSTWSEWKKFAMSEDVLSLSGGTMTGHILRSMNFTATTIVPTSTPYAIKCNNIERGITFDGIRTGGLCASYDANDKILAGMAQRVYGAGQVDLRLLSYCSDSSQSQVWLVSDLSNYRGLYPYPDNDINLGRSSYRWKQLYAGTTTISTSDERLKDNISAIPDEVLDAWGEVGWYQYQFKASIEEKGESRARVHTGAIAQRIESVFESHGLDANKYGLLCYDEWKSEPAERDEQGNIVQPARPAGNRYSLRYEEALCMEAAYQRRRADRLEQRLEAIEQRLSALETL